MIVSSTKRQRVCDEVLQVSATDLAALAELTV